MIYVDTEVYKNYFLVMFYDDEADEYEFVEMFPGQSLEKDEVLEVMRRGTLVSFNGLKYDMVILSAALSGADNERLKTISDTIIIDQMASWEAMRRFGKFDMTEFDHIDLIEVAPGIAGLKAYGARMHAPRLQDLPIEPDAEIGEADRPLLRRYCANDLQTTHLLYKKLKPQIDLRVEMSDEYGIDLRSKSDAQIAEAVIRSRVSQLKGEPVERPPFRAQTYKYYLPEFISAKTKTFQDVIDIVVNADYRVDGVGKMAMPRELDGYEVRIGDGVYRMGIGGLHSSEVGQAIVCDNDHVLVDRDVQSFYPSIILNLELSPPHMGDDFLQVYGEIVQQRLAAKASGDKVVADALKITINGSFGKLGSKWSTLYAPQLMIQVTMTGQLSLLMLIEWLEEAGIRVVSANTDGIVIHCRKDQEDELNRLIAAWEFVTEFVTEETRYKSVYSRDVNNYFAFKQGGGVKTKGAYAAPSLQKNPANAICVEAVSAFLDNGVPIEQTIRSCTDLTKFITVRSVKGGGVKDGVYLGKTVRWYMANGVSGSITYKSNGYTVARSEGGRPVMDLPKTFPDDVNYDWYIEETLKILKEIGYEEQADRR